MENRGLRPQPGADILPAAEGHGLVPEKTSTAKAFMLDLRISIVATVTLAVLVSGIYPLVVWAIGQGLFPRQAEGSLIHRNGIVVGSEWIAQNFESPRYFHPRPSAAGDAGYDAANSAGSNLGPLSQKLLETVKTRVDGYRAENGLAPEMRIPADAVTASGSGLDPHISARNAWLQAPRVAGARGISTEAMAKLLKEHTEGRDLWVFGEPRLNVLKLNLALDRM